MAYLEFKDIKRIFPGKFTLDMSLQMDKGELLCIIGPSGSGKSTLLSLLCGVDSPDEGRILIDGTDITDLAIQKRRIGMVFQDFSLFPSMDVAKNIQYGMKEKDQKNKDKRTEELLDLVGLEGYGKRQIHELSGGEAQRIALARALAAEPQILLLDEPLSALDAPLRKRLRTVIRQIHDKTGITMIYVTHDREEAFAIADRIMVLRGGRIEAIGTPQEIYSHPANLFTAFFTGEGSSLPMPQISDEPSEKTAFFRPEDIEIDKQNPTDNDIVLKDAQVAGCEYTGSGYLLNLIYKGHEIKVTTQKRPTSDTVSISVPKSKIVFF